MNDLDLFEGENSRFVLCIDHVPWELFIVNMIEYDRENGAPEEDLYDSEDPWLLEFFDYTYMRTKDNDNEVLVRCLETDDGAEPYSVFTRPESF